MVLQTRKSLACAAVLVAACALPTASAYQYTVGVGKDQSTGQPGLGFDPSRTTIADVNTANTVVFTFLEGIHRVVQTDGSLNAPCTPSGGFDTGVQTVPAGTNGPSFTFDVSNNTATYYFADIGQDASTAPCYLGAVFCLNTDETSSTTSCHAVQAAAVALGKEQGVTTTPTLSTSTSAAASGASSASSASSTSSSVTSTTSSASAAPSSASSSSASRSAAATGSAANAAASGASSGAGPSSFANGVTAAIGVAAAGIAALVAAV